MAQKNEILETKKIIDDRLYTDACQIIDQAQAAAYRVVNETLIKRNWLLGLRIQHEVLKEQRAEYGEQIIKQLSKELTAKYKTGFTKTNLYNYVGFYVSWPNFFHAVSGKSTENLYDDIFHALRGKSVDGFDILNSLRSQSPICLSWTHYRIILQENTDKGRAWYEQEAACEMWSTRTLQRNVSSFAFVDRQKHIHTEKEDYYIDLVFYNFHLRCFVLVDLKTTKLSHQDVGQMDMYVRMYDELVRPEGHNPTIGLLLCAETDNDVAHYSVLNGSDQLFAAKYLTYMPSQEELRREIEQQKQFFLEQQKNKEEEA